MTDDTFNRATAAPPRASFLGLPLELRQMIYKRVLSAPGDLNAFEIDSLFRPPFDKILCGQTFSVNILRSSRQCQMEATPIFWDANTLNLNSATERESLDSVSHFLARNILGKEKTQLVAHCADQTTAPFLDKYLSQVNNLAELFPKCKTFNVKITDRTFHQATMRASKFEMDATKFALSFTKSHPTLVQAIRTRHESEDLSLCSDGGLNIVEVDLSNREIRRFHFVTRDYILRNGETFIDLEAETEN